MIEEARRLAALADDMEERLRTLEARVEASSELSIPGPTNADLRHARRLARAARAQANTAMRMARKEGRAA